MQNHRSEFIKGHADHLESLLLLLTESQGYGATPGSLDLSAVFSTPHFCLGSKLWYNALLVEV